MGPHSVDPFAIFVRLLDARLGYAEPAEIGWRRGDGTPVTVAEMRRWLDAPEGSVEWTLARGYVEDVLGAAMRMVHTRVARDQHLAEAALAAGAERQRVTAEGYTQLPERLVSELAPGGGYVWFLRHGEHWEAWREADLAEAFRGEE